MSGVDSVPGAMLPKGGIPSTTRGPPPESLLPDGLVVVVPEPPLAWEFSSIVPFDGAEVALSSFDPEKK